MTAPDPKPEAIARIIAAEAGREGPLLPILHRLQEAFGFVPQEATPMIADALNLGRAEVHGVVSFYHDFRDEPAGRHVVKICRSEACQAVGGAALAEAVLKHFQTGWHGTGAAATVEPVFCLGLCANAPAAMVDGRLIAEATVDRIAAEVRP